MLICFESERVYISMYFMDGWIDQSIDLQI